jgi:recombination protein RecR
MIGESFINFFSKLPGVGLRSSKRIFFSLVQNHLKIEKMISVLNEIKENIFICKLCNNIGSQDICEICKSDKRDKSKLCIVLNIPDLYVIEESEIYDGCYLVLQNNESVKNSITEFIRSINLDKLRNIIFTNQPKEIIVANNLTNIGSAQSVYIAEIVREIVDLNNIECEITSLASGMPVGSEIEYLDTATIIASMSNRKKIS